ncbi:MAG: YraN family protein [Vicinamibacterales bacterium]
MVLAVQALCGMATDSRQSLGKLGEDLAAAELERLGYAILARSYRTRFGEIDIVAKQGDTIVFVEVKTRVGREFGGGAAAVTGWKQRRVTRMAVDYLARGRLVDCPCRFDVVAIQFEDGKPVIEVYANAFSV